MVCDTIGIVLGRGASGSTADFGSVDPGSSPGGPALGTTPLRANACQTNLQIVT